MPRPLEAPAVRRVSPQMSNSVNAKYGSKSVHLQVQGVAPTYLAIRNSRSIPAATFLTMK